MSLNPNTRRALSVISSFIFGKSDRSARLQEILPSCKQSAKKSLVKRSAALVHNGRGRSTSDDATPKRLTSLAFIPRARTTGTTDTDGTGFLAYIRHAERTSRQQLFADVLYCLPTTRSPGTTALLDGAKIFRNIGGPRRTWPAMETYEQIVNMLMNSFHVRCF